MARSINDIKQEVDSLTDKLDEPVDEHIKCLVVALRYLDFNTSASCEGHLDHGFAYPWVDMCYENPKIARQEKKRLKKLLQQFIKIRKPNHKPVIKNFADFRLQFNTEAQTQALLSDYQKTMDDLANFLFDSRHP